MSTSATLPGFCECGCGGTTALAKQSATKCGHVKGQPVRFIPGHQFRTHGPLYEVADCGHDTPCWRWLRHRDPRGYGRHGGQLAHKLFWERENGPVPDGLELDHLCRNPGCVNPDHLEAVTHSENMRRGKNAKLDVAAVRFIRSSAEDALTLSRRFGVNRQAIYNIRNRQRWKDVV